MAKEFYTQISMNADVVNGRDVIYKDYLVDYVEARISGAIKVPANLATTADLAGTYANGTAGVGATIVGTGILTVDGVTLTTPADAGKRVLVKDQTNGFENGIYTVTLADGTDWTLTRSLDMDQPADISYNLIVPVMSGGVNADQRFQLTTDVTPIVIGTTVLPFSKYYVATADVQDVQTFTVSATGAFTQTVPNTFGLNASAAVYDNVSGKEVGADVTVGATDITIEGFLPASQTPKTFKVVIQGEKLT